MNERVKSKLTHESQEAIKTLIESAKYSRQIKAKSVNYLNSYFKKAKDLIL